MKIGEQNIECSRVKCPYREVDTEFLKIINNFACGIAICQNDSWSTVIEANDTFFDITGYSREEMRDIFHNRFTTIIEDGGEELLQNVYETTVGNDNKMVCEFRIRAKSGKVVHIHNIATYDKEKDIFQVVIVDITAKEKVIETIMNRDRLDPLTQLPTLGKFKELATTLLENNKEDTFLLMKIDISHFSMVNELFGNKSGDELLVAFARAFEKVKYKTAIFARMGKDEFVALGTKEEFQRFSKERSNYNRILEMMVQKQIPHMSHHKLSFCIGAYELPIEERNIDVALNKASMAHRYAKYNHSHQVTVYDETLKNKNILFTNIRNRMKSALANGEFVPYIQPKYDIYKERVVGAEVLVRWIDESKMLYFPDEFIPIFERNRFILKLDMYMLKSVCKMLRAWIDLGYQRVPVSVNFSQLHLENKQFVAELVKCVDRYRVPHELIQVELTESALVNNTGVLVRLLGELKEAGFKVSVDDFGTGYSSLGLLRYYKFDTLKLDRSFFHNEELEDEERGNEIIKYTIKMARSLDMEVVAEGIEDKKQIEFLKETECNTVQGYYYAKPMTRTEFEERYLKYA